MNRLSLMVLNIAAALYLFANGIWGITKRSGISGAFDKASDFETMVTTIFGKGDFSNALIIVLSICAVAAAVFMLLSVFRIEVPITDLILLIFIILWIVFIIIVDIIHPLNSKKSVEFLPYLATLATHLMVLGALAMSTRRFGK